jgi:hypothetical protein
MGIGTMANYTGEICVNRAEAPSWGIQTYIVNGASETYPGHIVVGTGHTYPDCGRADADGDQGLGVAITCSGISITNGTTKIEIDTYYADNEQIEVAMVGSHLICWVYVDDDEGTADAWTPVYHTGADDDGFVELAMTIDVDTAFSEAGLEANFLALRNMTEQRYIGRLYKNMADQGSTDTPNKVVLC